MSEHERREVKKLEREIEAKKTEARPKVDRDTADEHDDRAHHNIETDAPGDERSLDDVNEFVETVIEQREKDRKGR